MTDYQLWLLDAFGNRIAVAPNDQISKLTYTLQANAVGAMTLTTLRDALPDAYITVDARLEIWRRPDGGTPYREGAGPWLLQGDAVGMDDKSSRYRRIKAVPMIHLLSRRAVMYYANSSQSAKGPTYADNLMKAIVRENFGSGANSSPAYTETGQSRDWSSLLAVQADTSQGPSTTKQFAWRNVLSVLQEIARDSASLGVPIYFDVVDTGDGMPTFTTWVTVRGIDRSSGANLLVISPERGSLGGTVERSVDWSDMATQIIAGGQGQNDSRVIGGAFDSSRIGLSPFGLREQFIDATQLSLSAALDAEAAARLRSGRPTLTLTGSLISVPGAVYGLDWNFGDRVVAQFEGDSFTARVDSITVTLDRGQETVTAAIRGET